MSPLVQRDWVGTSLDSNTRFGLQKPTSVLRVLYIMVGVMFFHIPTGVITWANGMEGGAPWALRWIIHRRRSALGHNSGSPDSLCPIFPGAVLLGCQRHRDEIFGL